MSRVIPNIARAAANAGDGSAVVAALGCTNGRVLSLLSEEMNLNMFGGEGSGERVRGESSKVTAVSSVSGPIILAIDGVDTSSLGTGGENDGSSSGCNDTDLAISTTVSLSGVILMHVLLHDLAREPNLSMRRLMGGIERTLTLRAKHVSPVLPARRLLIVAVGEYDEEEGVSDETVRSSVEDLLNSAYDGIQVPSAYVGRGLSDIFDVRVLLLHSAIYKGPDYDRDISELAEIIRDANKSYADVGMTPDGLCDYAERIVSTLDTDSSPDVPDDRELRATFSCNEVMKSALEKFRNTVKTWKVSIDSGRIVRNFGAEADRLIDSILQVYEKDGVVFEKTRAFDRKREELKRFLVSDCYALFAKQVLKVRENSYQVFRVRLARIRISDQVEKSVRGAVGEAEKYFIENGNMLRSNKYGQEWRFDNERYQLVKLMRDDATERLQMARLQGNYVPNIRAPIAFAFHTLMQAPFGSDSRFAHPHAEDMKQKFDPDKVKQPGMMRSRPTQTGPKVKVGKKDALGDDFNEIFSPLFGSDGSGAAESDAGANAASSSAAADRK